MLRPPRGASSYTLRPARKYNRRRFSLAALCIGGERVPEAGIPGLEAEILPQAAPVEQNLIDLRGFRSAAVGRRGTDRSKESHEVGRLVRDHIVDVVRG